VAELRWEVTGNQLDTVKPADVTIGFPTSPCCFGMSI